MSKRLTNKIVDERLTDLPIKRLGNVIGSRFKIECQCLISDCNYIWFPLLNSILQGKGCPKCAGKIKISNDRIDIGLIDRNIVRLDNIINGKTKIKFCCNICNYIWQTKPNIIIQGYGCPNCAKMASLTNEIVDNKLIVRDILRLDDIINSRTKINFQCKKCNFIWKAIPDKILNGYSGCPNCNLFSKNEKLIYMLLKENNIDYKSQFYIKNIDKSVLPYKLDVFIPMSKLALEYNGRQHYELTQFNPNDGYDDLVKNLIKQRARD